MARRPEKKILIVDDSASDIQFLLETLKNDYVVVVAKSGVKAIELAGEEPRPDAILLDVHMPEMNGYETCEILKKYPETQSIDVIFVSANDTIEEKLKGYFVGGSDYLTKPVRPEELLQKVRLAVKNSEDRKLFDDEKKAAMDTAMTAILDAGEQAVVVDFLRQSFTIHDNSELARLILDTTSKFDLSSSVQVRSPWEVVTLCSEGPVPPLEEELLNRLRSTTRIHQQGRRLILNFGGISQLVKNLPDDQDKCGRLRDHLALLLESADSRRKALNLAEELRNIMEESNEALLRIHEIQSRQKTMSLKIIDTLMDDVQTSFLTYGLSEEQEDMLLKTVRCAIDASVDNFEKGIQIDSEMEMIINRIKGSIQMNGDFSET